MNRRLLCSFLLSVGLAGMGSDRPSFAAADPAAQPGAGDERIIFRTVAGDLVFKLYPEVAPKTVAQIKRMAQAGLYDSSHFFWIERGFIVQVPLPYERRAPLSAEQVALIQKIPGEFSALKHRRGVLSMSRQAADKNSGQGAFSILLGDAPQLDGHYTIFGELEAGWDVLRAIETVPLKDRNVPAIRIEIAKAEVVSASKLPKLKLAPAAAMEAPSCHPGPSGMIMEQPSAQIASPASTSPSTAEETWPPKAEVPITVQDVKSEDGERIKTILFKNMLIDRVYPSMRGPWARQYVSLDPAHEGKYLWITGYRAEVLDGKTGSASQEFMCHTNVDMVGAAGTPRAFQNVHSQLSISQGQKEIVFPGGFALRVDNGPEVQTEVNVMVLNNNYPDIHKTLDFKATIRYLDDKAANTRKLTPLFLTAVSASCPTQADPSSSREPVCKPASKFLVGSGPDKRTGHWLVPPGRQVIINEWKGLNLPYDTTAHYIWMHVHPYAESLELRDKTTATSVWKGYVKNDPRQALVVSSDHYSSPQGIRIYKAHQYEMVTTYNNRTDHPMDAMAALWMYFRHKDPDSRVQAGEGEKKVKVVLFKDLLIDRIYPSMQGPWKNEIFTLDPLQQGKYVWIAGYRAEVLDGTTGSASQEFMCHTNLELVGAPGAPPEFQNRRSQLSISQGQKEINFPEGFALRLESIPERRIELTAMVLNNNYPHIRKNLDFRSTIQYYDDSAARAKGLTPLFQSSAFTSCIVDPPSARDGEMICEPATAWEVSDWPDGRKQTGHWWVPPGRQTITTNVTKIINLPYDTTAHYIWMHVHPYAESMELRDMTAQRTVWMGRVKNHQKKALVLRTDRYAATEGIPFYKDHQYELTTIYNNRTDHKIDAMAALWMYFRDHN